MNTWSSHFDHKSLFQWVVLIVCFTAGYYFLADRKLVKQINKNARVLVVIEKTAKTDTIELGGIYFLDITVEKIRDDCSNGVIITHMRNLRTGAWYKTEETKALQLPVGKHPFPLEYQTRPLNLKDMWKMQSGRWVANRSIVYQCPEGEVEYSFETPPFTVVREQP